MNNKNEPDPEGDFWLKTLDLIRFVLIGNPLKRFFTTIFLGGLTLIGGEGIWYLITEYLIQNHGLFIERPEPDPDKDRHWLTVRNSGLLFCATGITLHLVLFFFEQFRSWKDCRKDRKNKVAQLVGTLRAIVDGFSDQSLERSSGFMSDDICNAKRLAISLASSLPESIVSEPIFAIICDPKIDASGVNPYHGIRPEQLSEFADLLARFWEKQK